MSPRRGDRIVRKLEREIETGRMAAALAPELSPEVAMRGLQATEGEVRAAAARLADDGRSDEAIQRLVDSTSTDPAIWTIWDEMVHAILADLDTERFGPRISSAGRPGASGILSRIVHLEPLDASECFGRFHPVIDRRGDVVLEDDEAIDLTFTATGVAELTAVNRRDGTAVWSYEEPVEIRLTNRRAFFATTGVPARSARAEAVMTAGGAVLVGQFRWSWLMIIERAHARGLPVLVLHGLSAANNKDRRSLVLSMPDDETMVEIVRHMQKVGDRELRRRWDENRDDVRAQIDSDLETLAELPDRAHCFLRGIYPIGFLTRAEAADARTVEAVKAHEVPETDAPLREL